MVVNEYKTEIMWIGKEPQLNEICINWTKCSLVKSMKALGIYIQGDLSWDTQAEFDIKKGQKLASCFGYVRKYLTEDQFLKAATADYYESVFYASSVWFQNIKVIFKTKFNSIHFRILGTATRLHES